MSEWKKTKVGDFGKVITGYTPPTQNLKLWIGEIPFYSPSDFNDDVYCSNTERVVAPEALSNDRIVQENSLMVTCIASIGKIALAKRQGISNQQINTIIFNENFNPKYCYYLFKYNINELLKLAGTTAVPIVNKASFEKILLKHHSDKIVQTKIAHILSTADAVIEKTQAAIAKYKAIKQGMLHDLFTRGIDLQTNKLRPKYQDAPHLYKESKLGWIPKEWEENELMFYLSFISYGFTNPMPETNDGPYLVTAANINHGIVQYDLCRKTAQEAFDILLTDKSRPKTNDILLTKDGTLGRIALVDKENLCINQSVAVLRPKSSINPLFLKILLESPAYQKTMLDEAGGSTIKHIYITIVDKMALAVPKNTSEQTEIANRLKSIDNKIQTEQNYLQKLQQIKAGLIADLLSGKKEVIIEEEMTN